MQFQENDRVETLVDKPNCHKGTKGVIVGVYPNSAVFEVECWDEDNYPFDVITFEAKELKKIT